MNKEKEIHASFAVVKVMTTERGKHVFKMEKALNLWVEDRNRSVLCQKALSLHGDVRGRP